MKWQNRVPISTGITKAKSKLPKNVNVTTEQRVSSANSAETTGHAHVKKNESTFRLYTLYRD